jgi:hypothetical protein
VLLSPWTQWNWILRKWFFYCLTHRLIWRTAVYYHNGCCAAKWRWLVPNITGVNERQVLIFYVLLWTRLDNFTKRSLNLGRELRRIGVPWMTVRFRLAGVFDGINSVQHCIPKDAAIRRLLKNRRVFTTLGCQCFVQRPLCWWTNDTSPRWFVEKPTCDGARITVTFTDPQMNMTFISDGCAFGRCLIFN